MFKSAYIFGSGFGLYGYLPALNRLNFDSIQMSPRYAEALKSRTDLKGQAAKVLFRDFDPAMLQDKELVIIFAKRPIDQERFLEQVLETNQIQATLLLEKPLARNPCRALRLINRLAEKSVPFRINYVMKYCEWHPCLGPQDSFRIRWDFKAHHFKTDSFVWKRYKEDGGGVLRFYGIHFIHLFFTLYRETAKEIRLLDADSLWTRISVELLGNSGQSLRIDIDSNQKDERFCIERQRGNTIIFESQTPFSSTLHGSTDSLSNGDRRIGLLVNFIKSSRAPLASIMIEDYRQTEVTLMHLEKRFEEWTVSENR